MLCESGLSSGASRHSTNGLADEPDSTKHLHQQKKMKEFIQWITDMNRVHEKGKKEAYQNILSWMEVQEEKTIYKTLVKFIKEELK